ncbi:hypothetical protein LPJ60_005502, partial [Coemansia sp. RSA 2675]
AITDYLRAKGGRGACPVGGCSRVLNREDLAADPALERNVARRLRQLEAEESSVTYTMVQ